jgi:hypothetical protein
MYTYGYSRRLSSRPRHLTAPNGLNFSQSVGNPTSRLEKVRTYLTVRGEATKVDILRDVFDKTVGNGVTRGWGSCLFQYGVHHGFFTKVRRGNKVYWSLR